MAESIQKKWLRTSPVRCRVTYDVETGGDVEKRELPFVVGVFADLSGDCRPAASFRERFMLPLDRDNLDAVLKACAPAVDLSSIPQVLPGAASATLSGMLRFECLADFDSKAVLSRVEGLSALMANAETRELASKQLSLILHAPVFQALEATWRSLHRLVTRIETGPQIQLRVLNATRQELFDDVVDAIDFDQSRFFKLIYEAEYGTYGGTPYSLLLGAYEFDATAASMTGLEKIAEVAAAAHAPFVAAASAQLFRLQFFSDLGRPRSLEKIFESPELAAWQNFRESKDAHYTALVLPRVLLRVPAGYEPGGAPDSEFVECLTDEDRSQGHHGDSFIHESLLWGNPVFLLAERIAEAARLHGLPLAFLGSQSGGVVDGLSCFEMDRPAGGRMQVGPTEVSISDRRRSELTELGFIALCSRKDADQAAFFEAPSISMPKKYVDSEATAHSSLTSKLPCILVASRFAHYIKVIARDKVGSFLTRGNLESYLNTWLSQYVLLDDGAAPEIKAAYPLRHASLVLVEVPGSPGAYRATLFVQPGYQMEQIHTSLRLEIDLPG